MFIRLYTGSDGESQFEDLQYPFEPADGRGRSPSRPAKEVFFSRSPAGFDMGWHTAPQRQYVVSIAGSVQLTLRDGTYRRVSPGDVLLAEDLKGSGHHTKVIGDEERVSLIIPLGD
jgi:hypothetical protein